MGAKSGAGASVSSGASFQARVGAFTLVTALCKAENELSDGKEVSSISFETTEAVDDINLKTKQNTAIYVQAKAKIDYSLREGGELRSVMAQFERQSRLGQPEGQYILVTSSRSSRKVIFEMRAALDAYRSGDEARFRKDQPKALVEVVDDLLRTLAELRAVASLEEDRKACSATIYRTKIQVMDIEANDPTEQAIILLLRSQNFVAPSAVWGKIVADCVTYSKLRQTIRIEDAERIYARYCVSAGEVHEPISDDFIRVELGQLDAAVGREVVLGWLRSAEADMEGNADRYLVIMEFYRFDDDCNERLRFESGKCIAGNGLEIDLIRRAATYVGMERLITRETELTESEAAVFVPYNGDDDLEIGLCAEEHRARIRQAALANLHPLHCLHCGRPVSSLTASMIETGSGNDLVVGLSHQECLAPVDRVLGVIRSRFFEDYPELVNFDINGWFKAAQNGQRAFSNAEQIRSADVVIGWGGKKSSVEPGTYVVEMLLLGGAREIAIVRNGVHRFRKAEAERFAERLNREIAERGNKDPLCYTDESKGFGPKSLLIPIFAGKEKIIPIERARARPHDERFSAQYTRPGSWYAPLLLLRSIDDSQPIMVLQSVALLTNPIKLGHYLANWREAGLLVTNYEVLCLLTDAQFDDLMVEMSEQNLGIIVDPLLALGEPTQLVGGVRVSPLEHLAPATSAIRRW